MPAVSKKQRRAAALALEAKEGNFPVSRLKGSALSMYNSMSEKELRKFASTKEKGLPDVVKKKKKSK